MRGLIIDYVRERRAQKRGGEFVLTPRDTDACGLAAVADVGPLGERWRR